MGVTADSSPREIYEAAERSLNSVLKDVLISACARLGLPQSGTKQVLQGNLRAHFGGSGGGAGLAPSEGSEGSDGEGEAAGVTALARGLGRMAVAAPGESRGHGVVMFGTLEYDVDRNLGDLIAEVRSRSNCG